MVEWIGLIVVAILSLAAIIIEFGFDKYIKFAGGMDTGLHCEKTGSGPMNVLFIPALDCDSLHEIKTLVAKYARTITIDQPSKKQDITEYCKLIHLAMNEQVTIVAHSTGCLIAKVYAQLYPKDVMYMALLDPVQDDQIHPFVVANSLAIMAAKWPGPSKYGFVAHYHEKGRTNLAQYKDWLAINFGSRVSYEDDGPDFHIKNAEAIAADIRDLIPPDFLYHGSDVKITGQLEPRPSKVIEGERAVFAARERRVALMFIGKHSSADIDLGHVNDVPYICEMYEGAMDKLKGGGYIYKISSAGFRTDSRLGMSKHEYINYAPVTILDAEVIEDALAELKKDKGIKFVRFADREAFLKEFNAPPR